MSILDISDFHINLKLSIDYGKTLNDIRNRYDFILFNLR